MKIVRVMILVLLTFLTVGCTGKKTEILADESENITDCVSSIDSNGDLQLTIIANRYEIADKEEFAKELIKKVCDNSFKTIRFSYDENGYPLGLYISVYLNEGDWKDREIEPYMSVSFRQDNIVDGYNIVDNYEKFSLKID